MVSAGANELSPVVTGLVYCTVIACCHQVYEVDRAREWTSALAEWCEAQPQLVTFTGTCLVHRAEVMQISGDWDSAIAEARRVSDRFGETVAKESVAEARYQEAEIHRLRGAFEEAEAAYREASKCGGETQPGLALLRLAQGRGDDAAAAISRVVATATKSLQRARLLPAAVEILIVVGKLDEARIASQELSRIASTLNAEVLTAIALHAAGAVKLAEGDAQSAVGPLGEAYALWRRSGAPYLAARIRVLIGLACRALGDEGGAGLAFEGAREVFDRLDATPDLTRLDALSKRTTERKPSLDVLTPREVEVLRLVASGKTNKAIARQLTLSEKTVDRHLSNILTKLAVPSRAAATAYAYSHKLI